MTPERLAELLDAATGTKVAVIGDAMYDIWVDGASSINPEDRDVPLLRSPVTVQTMGGAGFAFEVVKRFGGLVGGVFGPRRHKKTRVIVDGKLIVRHDADDVTEDIYDSGLTDQCVGLAEWADVVLISDYDKGMCELSRVQAIIKAGKPVIVDPKVNHAYCYSGAYLVKPNYAEMKAVTGRGTNLAAKYAEETHVPRVLLTNGQDGMTLYRPPLRDHFPALSTAPVDVTGAGDVVAATFAVLHAAGADDLEACEVASIAAAIAVERERTYAPSPLEIRTWV